jgi:hypothetical protein
MVNDLSLNYAIRSRGMNTNEVNVIIKKKPRRWFPPIALACALAAGCSSGSEPYKEESNLRALAAYYTQYTSANRGQFPPSEKALKEYIKAERAGRGVPAADADINALFVSNRDGKPFVIRYRTDKSWPYGELVAYEQEGQGGTRHVATAVGGYDEMSEERFQSQKVAPVAALSAFWSQCCCRRSKRRAKRLAEPSASIISSK